MFENSFLKMLSFTPENTISSPEIHLKNINIKVIIFQFEKLVLSNKIDLVSLTKLSLDHQFCDDKNF